MKDNNNNNDTKEIIITLGVIYIVLISISMLMIVSKISSDMKTDAMPITGFAIRDISQSKESEPLELTQWEIIQSIIDGKEKYVNINICEGMDIEFKDQCFSVIAPIIKNTDICNSIVDNRKKDRCYTSIATKTGSTEICENLSNPDFCYVEFMKDNNFSTCNRITDQYLRQSCFALNQVNRILNASNDIPIDYLDK